MLLWIWVLLWTDTCAQIRFLADQDTDEIQTHESAPAAVEICSHGFSLVDGGVPQSKQYLLLLIACNQGTLHLSGDLTSNLVDTICLCVSSADNPQQNKATATLSVYSGGSCIKLSGFLLGDSKEPDTVDSQLKLLPISILRLGVEKGTLRVNRRAAFAKGIYAVGSDGKNVGEATLAWTLPDLVDKSLVLRGGVEDLNSFLPAVEYCSSADQSSVAPDTLVMTLSNYDVGIDAKLKVSASLTISIEFLPKKDVGNTLVTAEKTTNDDKQPQKNVFSSQLDTISQSLPQLGDSNLIAAGNIRTQVSQKLLIQLPTSYLRVWFNQSLVIEGIGFQGYTSNGITFTASCSKGTIQLLPKSSIKPVADVLKISRSMLQISGQYSTLKDTLKNNYFTYAPSVSSRGFDRLELRIESLEDQATEVLPIEIEAPPKPPSLVLPMTPVNVTANETTTIKGVTMFIEQEDGLQQIPHAYGIRIKAQHGQLGLVADVSGRSLGRTAEVQFESGIENINAALEELQYRAPAASVLTEDLLVFLMYSIETISGQVSPEVSTELVIRVVEQETELAPAFVLPSPLDFEAPQVQWAESGVTTSSLTNSSRGDDKPSNTLKEEAFISTEDPNAPIGKAVNLEEISDIPTDAKNVDLGMGGETSTLDMHVQTETDPHKLMVNSPFPEKKQSYRILVPAWARSLNVTKNQSLDLSKVFTVDERLESKTPLMARVIVLSGFIRITASSCGEVRDVAGDDEYGMTQHIYAPDTACMNQALESLLLYQVRSVTKVELELFDDEGQLLANDSVGIEALDPVPVVVVSEVLNSANISDVEQNSSTQTTMSSNRTRKLPATSRAVKPKLTTTFGLNVSAKVIEVKVGESSSLGDILTASGIPEDPTWFRLKASVASGTLFIPMSVCCVDIRKTKTNSEIDVIGTAWGIRRALAAVEFQSGERLLRKDILRITINPYASKLSSSGVSFEVPINLIDTHSSPSIADNTENTTFARVLESVTETNYGDALNEREQIVDITPDELENLLNPIEAPSYAYLSSLLEDYLSGGQYQQYIPVEELQEDSLIES